MSIIRRKKPIFAEFNSPGPAIVSLPSLIGRKVSDSRIKNNPVYTIRSRSKEKSDSKTPGPGKYKIESYIKKTTPEITIHTKFNESKIEILPGPGQYNVERDFSFNDSPKFSFGRRVHAKVRDDTPAPNVYNITNIGKQLTGPKISTVPKIRDTSKKMNHVTPSPGNYHVPNLDLIRKKPPSFSIGIRTQQPASFCVKNTKLCPNSYYPEKVTFKNPKAFSFGIKHSEFKAPVIN